MKAGDHAGLVHCKADMVRLAFRRRITCDRYVVMGMNRGDGGMETVEKYRTERQPDSCERDFDSRNSIHLAYFYYST